MGNNKSSNPFISNSSKPDYFQNYKFNYFCFEIYDGIEPDIDSRYPTSQYDGIIYQGDDIFMEITICTIHLTMDNYSPSEIIWLIKSKSYDKLFKPIYKEDNLFCSWLDLIYSWTKTEKNVEFKETNQSSNINMYPCDNTFTDYYITRQIYFEQDPNTPQLKTQVSKTHYIEWIGGPKPNNTCDCCGQTRSIKPTEDEFINSTMTTFDIKQKDFGIKFSSDHLNLYYDTGFQISASINYYPKKNKIDFNWKHWTHPDESSCYYAQFYKGKFFENEKGHRLKYYYPEWVNDDTIWRVSTYGETGWDMFPELSKKDCELESMIYNTSDVNTCENITKSKKDYSTRLNYTDCVTNSVNLKSNKFVSELFDLVFDLWNEIKQFIPDDNKENNIDVNKTIKYSELEDLDLLRTELIEYFNQLDQNDFINILVNKLKNFTPNMIPELYNKVYTSTPMINSLIDKYSQPILNSSDVLVYCLYDYFDKKTWIGKTIVNNNLVNIIKEIHIQNNEIILAKKNSKTSLFINGIEQKDEYINHDTNIIVNNSDEADEIAFDLIVDLVKKTWPNKNIIKYEKEDSQITKSKYKIKEIKPIDFKILSWIREKK
jgi:hypothetical protein